MVYQHEHILLRFNGHFGTNVSAVDKWSCGLRFGFAIKGTDYDAGKLQTFVNTAKVAAGVMHATNAMTIGASCFLDTVTGAQIGVLGKYEPAAQMTVISPSTPVGGVGQDTHPWNTALVISLRTQFPRGTSSNGRVYWPATGAAVQAQTGRLSAGAVATRLAAVKTFLDALNTAAGTYDPGMKLIVASNVGGGNTGVVSVIRSDTRLDSIERRENDQLPEWSTASLA